MDYTLAAALWANVKAWSQEQGFQVGTALH